MTGERGTGRSRGRAWIRAGVSGACTVLIALTAGAAPSLATTATGTTVRGVTLTAGRTVLIGPQLTTLTVAVHLTDPTGVTAEPGHIGDYAVQAPFVYLAATGRPVTPSANNGRVVQLRLVAGTPQDGTWRGTAILGAANAGTWRPVSVYAGTLKDTRDPDDPQPVSPPGLAGTASLVLHGSRWPVLTVRLPATPAPGHPFVVRGTARLAGTGEPATGVRLVVPSGDACDTWLGLGFYAPVLARAGRTGSWAVGRPDRGRTVCAEYGDDALGQPVAVVTTTARSLAPLRSTVSAAPARRTAARGTDVSVRGRVWPVNSQGVILERLVGGRWHVVGRAVSGRTGAYTLTATPPARGRNTYRVAVSSKPDLALRPGMSPQFVLTGT